MKNIILVFFSFFSFSTFADYNLQAKIRQYHMSCGYYSKTTAEVEIEFKNWDVNEDGKWVIDYAWQSEGESELLWNTQQFNVLKNNKFSVVLAKDIIVRGSPDRFKKLHFFLKQISEGQVVGKIPKFSPINHFVLDTLSVESTSCLDSVGSLPDFIKVEISELE